MTRRARAFVGSGFSRTYLPWRAPSYPHRVISCVRMTRDDFLASLSASDPPDVSATLKAMWRDARGDWNGAHEVAQAIDDEIGAWIHAYLHRNEGDPGNAAYWYGRAKQPVAKDSLDAEWRRIVDELLK